jgi:uncharacterized membrane-anchored protein
MLNKVPEITLYFWIIKILCTTVGETFADNLNSTLNLGLINTTLVMAGLLIAVLVVQFRARGYVPGLYWLAVVLISVVGTLITDNLTDNAGVSLVTTTVIFAVVLAAVFAGWYVGYWRSGLLFAALIGLITAVHYALRGRLRAAATRHASNAVLAFWLAYILTRPLGASIGDYLSQTTADGGLGLGTVGTSALFLAAILALVGYLTVTHADEIPLADSLAEDAHSRT